MLKENGVFVEVDRDRTSKRERERVRGVFLLRKSTDRLEEGGVL